MPRNVAPGLKAAYSMSWAFIKSTITSEPYSSRFFSIGFATFVPLRVIGIGIENQNGAEVNRLGSFQQPAPRKQFQRVQQLSFSCAARGRRRELERGDLLENLSRRRRDHRLEAVVAECVGELAHFLGATACVQSQRGDAAADFV